MKSEPKKSQAKSKNTSIKNAKKKKKILKSPQDENERERIKAASTHEGKLHDEKTMRFNRFRPLQIYKAEENFI